MSTVLTDAFTQAKDLFNNGNYNALADYLDLNVEMKEVDPPGPTHKTRAGVIQYLNDTQRGNLPQFDPGNPNDWKVSDAGTIGTITGQGTYQDSLGAPQKPVLYCFVFQRTAVYQNWLLTLAFASLL